jgi:hypothetical protein
MCVNNVYVQYKIIGVAPRYGLDYPLFKPRRGQIFGLHSGRPQTLLPSCTTGIISLFHGQNVHGVTLTAHSNSRLTFPPICARLVCNTDHLCNGTAYILYTYLSVVSAGLRPLILHSGRHFRHIY